MEPQTTESQNLIPPNINIPSPEPRRSNKSLLLVLLTVLIVVIIGFGYFIYINTTQKITGLDVAQKIALFLDKTIQLDGGMLAGFGCAPSGSECSPLPVNENQPHLGQAIYAYYLLAQETGDKSYRMKADNAMDFILDKCQSNVQMCAWNFFPLSRYYFDTKEDKYLQGMLKPAQEFLRMSHADIVAQNVGHKLASLYLATKDERYKTRLLEIADEELLNWPNKPDHSVQVVWSVFIPAYNITQDDKYLLASEHFFDNFNLGEKFNDLYPVQTGLKGVDALLNLAEISSHKNAYRTQAKEAFEKAMRELWDEPEHIKVNGDYGFLDRPSIDQKVKFKMTINNGWFAKLFAMMADERFNLSPEQ